MKSLIFLSALANAQVDLFTGNWRNVSLDAVLVAMQGGSIIDHLQQRLNEYGIPQEFLDDLEANVTDAAWAGIVTGWSRAQKNNIKDTFDADFYANTIFGGLVLEENVQLVVDVLAPQAPADLEANMTNVVDNLLDNFINAMADFSADQTNATLVRGVMSELNIILGEIAGAYGISRSPVKRFAALRRYAVGFLLAYEHALDVPDYYNEAMAYVQNMVDTALLDNIGNGICYVKDGQVQMGPFEYFHGWIESLVVTNEIVLGLMGEFQEASYELFDALFDNNVGMFVNLRDFYASLEIGEILEDMEDNIHMLSITFDPFVKGQFYELIKGPICGVQA